MVVGPLMGTVSLGVEFSTPGGERDNPNPKLVRFGVESVGNSNGR